MFKIYRNVLTINRFLVKYNQIQLKQIQTNGTTSPNLSPKKLEEQIKKQVLFYIDNELPDKQLDNDLKPLKQSIKIQVYNKSLNYFNLSHIIYLSIINFILFNRGS